VIELPIRRLPRNQQQRVQGDAFDELAETLVAEEFDLSQFTDADWYDCVDRDSGVKYEVKSTSDEIRSGPGRFRLWQQQHRSMTTSEGQNSTAWYAFVLLDLEDGVIKIQRRKPSTVTRILNQRGGWNQSGHESKGRQHKVPIWAVM